jgi:alpha,alpha-trehalase
MSHPDTSPDEPATACDLNENAEEPDVGSGQHLGNYPQAFTHLALIDAVMLLIELETTQAARD